MSEDVKVEHPEARQERFRSWWNRLTDDQKVRAIRSGHVRSHNLRASAPRRDRKPKRTQEAQRRAAEHAEEREKYGEAYVHMTPSAKQQRYLAGAA